jgi:hypothetical protein
MLVVERGSVNGALRIPAPIPVPFDLVRSVNVLERIARGSLWLLLLQHMRVCLEALSVLKEILVLKTGET